MKIFLAFLISMSWIFPLQASVEFDATASYLKKGWWHNTRFNIGYQFKSEHYWMDRILAKESHQINAGSFHGFFGGLHAMSQFFLPTEIGITAVLGPESSQHSLSVFYTYSYPLVFNLGVKNPGHNIVPFIAFVPYMRHVTGSRKIRTNTELGIKIDVGGF